MTSAVRPAAVAGSFYPAAAEELSALLDNCFNASSLGPGGAREPDPSIIGGMVPHAGPIYSGPCAAHFYARLESPVQRIILLGVNHRTRGHKAALSPWRRWQIPLGDMGALAKSHPSLPPGSVSLGGSIITGGGLVFVAGTIDSFIRAFDIETGKELWKAQLPASGAATPITYQTTTEGKQYLVIAAGGHSKVTEESQSDALVAFALP